MNNATANKLAAVLAYRNRPDVAVPEPMRSNWTLVPANDNADPEEVADFGLEWRHGITPSKAEIMRQVRKGPVVRNAAGQIIAIGALRFSDGTQYEKAQTIGPSGHTIWYDRRMPAGAMLGTKERQSAAAGAGESPERVAISNSSLSKAFGVEPRGYIEGTRKRRRGKSYSAAQSRALLAEAVANTPILPPAFVCPPGLPTGTAHASDCFVGMKIAASGKSGAVGWVDILTSRRDRQDWFAAEQALDAETKAVLDQTMSARSIAELGSSGHRRTRERQGWTRLQAANDVYSSALAKISA